MSMMRLGWMIMTMMVMMSTTSGVKGVCLLLLWCCSLIPPEVSCVPFFRAAEHSLGNLVPQHG
jgi:hypothetical protein